MKIDELSKRVIDEVEHAILGKRQLLEMVMTAILVNGHVLFEDNPGLGKTTLVRSMAAALGLEFRRIQFTPDLLPSDIVGGYIFNRERGQFDVHKGPIFSNVILADEINRASPKTQSALLEAMEEGQVTLEGERMPLPEPFIVLATQNPIEFEGTFPLPEAQLDRFLMRLRVGYPTLEVEQMILQNRKLRKQEQVTIHQKTSRAELIAARHIIEDVFLDADLEKYIVQIVRETRIDTQVTIGASPRGSLALFKSARAWACQQGRDYVIPDDIKQFAVESLAHRLLLVPQLWSSKFADCQVISRILQKIPVPVINQPL